MTVPPAAAPVSAVQARELTCTLTRLGRIDECFDLWRRPDIATPENLAWLDRQAWRALDARELAVGGDYGRLFAFARWRSGLDPQGRPTGEWTGERALPPVPVPYLSVAKLQHDIEQFRHLRDRGLLGDGFDDVISHYRRIAGRLTAAGALGQVPLTDADNAAIGHVYNRLVHVGTAPRLDQALSDGWNPAEVEDRYLDDRAGVAVIDDFLTPRALRSLRSFCLESTVWSANRYAHGRLGAFFRDGFNCPLLLQIAQELEDRLPRVLGRRYPLRQLWAFKNGRALPPGGNTHADFAAVNVNFWITPTEANLDPDSGGLLVHRADAPPDWDFDTYNGSPEVIGRYLSSRHVRSVTIPYRANRAIVFNSDLFHATAGVRFKSGYENRRINITMLYGERADDVHHRNPQADPALGARTPTSAAWRSAAFARTRSTDR